MQTLTLNSRFEHLRVSLRKLKGNAFARNLGSLGGAQIAIRISRLIATVVLSRLLLPHEFGLAAVVLTIYEVVALFTRNGIAAKVVQASAEALPLVAMTAYRMTWLVCIGLTIAQALIAWPISWFYQDASIALPIAAMGVIYLATPLCSIQGALQQREGKLGRFAMASAVQVITDNFLTVVLALLGFGMWAIILPKIIVAPIWVVFIRYGHAWRPHTLAAHSRFEGWQDIARFSRRVLGVEMLTTLQTNLDNVLVGYFLGMHALGLYYFAFNGGLGITLGLINAAGMAVYPHLCQVRQDENALRQRFFKTTKLMGAVLVPAILLQALLSPYYVPVVFGEKWVEAIPALAMICLSALARPFANIVSQLLKAVGQPEIELRWQLATTFILGLALLVSCQMNINAVAFAVFAVQTIMLSAFVYFTCKRIFPKTVDTLKSGVLS